MNLLVFCAIIAALISEVVGAWTLKEDRACDPMRDNKLIPYTGFRLHRQYTYGYPMLHHQRLTHCNMGKVDMEAYLPLTRNMDIMWGQNMCVNNQLCYRAVRRKKYAHRQFASLYVPHTIVGGLFQCPVFENCTNDNAFPVMPLVADKLKQQWIEMPKLKRIVQRVPYFYTPNFLDRRYSRRPENQYKWAKHMDVDERYEYTKRDKMRLNHVQSKVLNIIHNKLSIDPNILPWETSRVIKELERDLNDHHKSIDLLQILLPVFKKMTPRTVDLFIKQLQTPSDHLTLDNDDDLVLDDDPLHEFDSSYNESDD